MRRLLDKFINKTIYHGVCSITPNSEGETSAALPTGIVFTGQVDATAFAGGGQISIGYVAQVNNPVRNFRFKVVRDSEPYHLPHNMAYVGSHLLVPMVGHHYHVYVEKEL